MRRIGQFVAAQILCPAFAMVDAGLIRIEAGIGAGIMSPPEPTPL